MIVRTKSDRSRIRPRLRRRAHGAAEQAAGAPQTPAAPAPQPQARERAAGGPEDRASYRCTCGYVFEAPVSASVACPHCGDAQAW